MFKSFNLTFLLLLSLVYISVNLAAPTEEPVKVDDLLTEYTEVTDDEWESYKKKFEKKYEAEEDAVRRKLYDERKKSIVEHNKMFQAGKVSWTQGLNQFADRKPEENKPGLIHVPRTVV